jgi:sporulation protein YlmC with PRC-barrel domain
MRIQIDDIKNRKVIDAGGVVLGDIDELYLDSQTLNAHTLVVKLRRDLADDLGVEKHTFTRTNIGIPASAVQAIGDTVVLRVRAAELRGLADEEHDGDRDRAYEPDRSVDDDRAIEGERFDHRDIRH